jgi:hypothetical protein
VAEPAGYSGAPLAKKLGIKDGGELALLDAPLSWSVPELPDGVTVARASAEKRRQGGGLTAVDVALIFCRTATDVAAVPSLVGTLPTGSSLWVAWPRKAGGHVSDVDENLLREVLLPTGVVDVKVAALDVDWSGLKFVWRKENR